MYDENDEPDVVWSRATFEWRKASELEVTKARNNDPRYFRVYPMDVKRMGWSLALYKNTLKTREQLKKESDDSYFDEEYR